MKGNNNDNSTQEKKFAEIDDEGVMERNKYQDK